MKRLEKLPAFGILLESASLYPPFAPKVKESPGEAFFFLFAPGDSFVGDWTRMLDELTLVYKEK